MAGTLEWTAKRHEMQQEIKYLEKSHNNFKDENNEAIQRALEVCPTEFIEELSEVTLTSQKVAGLGATYVDLLKEMEEVYGAEILRLHKYKAQNEFGARFRDFVTMFEDQVFKLFIETDKYKQAVRAGTKALKNRGQVLELLQSLAAGELNPAMSHSAEEHASKLLLKEAWDEAVVTKHLKIEEYQALRSFKDFTNRAFHKPFPPADGLRELTTSLPVPEQFVMYKEVLVKLLRLLQ